MSEVKYGYNLWPNILILAVIKTREFIFVCTWFNCAKNTTAPIIAGPIHIVISYTHIRFNFDILLYFFPFQDGNLSEFRIFNISIMFKTKMI